MGRPPGQKNAAKKKAATGGEKAPREAPRKQAAAASAPKPNGPSDSQIQEWLAEMTELDTAMSRVRAKSATLKKTVENRSGDWKALKAAFSSTKLSQAEAIAKLEQSVRYHQAINVRVSWDQAGQGGFADVLDGSAAPEKNLTGTRDLSAARAEMDGYNSGKAGAVPHDNPFHAGTEEYVRWHDGRDSGQQDREGKHPTEAARIAAAVVADATLPSDGLEDMSAPA